jgi:polyhydroxybutyrate depolymerase
MRHNLKSAAWILTVMMLGAQLSGCGPEPVEIGKTVYQKSAASANCRPGTRTGKAGVSNDEITPNGVKFNVRTPSNYDPAVQHPLIVVYAPAGRSRFGNEKMTNLTLAATQAGFVIAYPDHRRMSGKTLIEMARIPEQVAGKWCIDENRIYLTGHSDGGTIAMGLAFLEDTRHIPDAIAASASGIRGSDLAAYPCPEPISVLIMHSKNDRLFPGFGKEAAEWWANCNQCAKDPKPIGADRCVQYPNCAGDVRTWFCEGTAQHAKWPNLNARILDFFGTNGAHNPTGSNAEPEMNGTL